MVAVEGIPRGEHDRDDQDRIWQLAEAAVLKALQRLRDEAAERQTAKSKHPK